MLTFDINAYPLITQFYYDPWLHTDYFAIHELTSLELVSRRIVRYKTDRDNIQTVIRSHEIQDDALAELLSFFSLDSIRSYKPKGSMSAKTFIGYSEFCDLKCVMMTSDCCCTEIVESWHFSDDLIQMALDWMEKWYPDVMRA